jgi:hypothetical protein
MDVQIIKMPAVTPVRTAPRFFFNCNENDHTHEATNWVLWLQLLGSVTALNEEKSRS